MYSLLTRRTLHQEGPVKEEDASVEEAENVETEQEASVRV
jgi:hypothetical protein